MSGAADVAAARGRAQVLRYRDRRYRRGILVLSQLSQTRLPARRFPPGLWLLEAGGRERTVEGYQLARPLVADLTKDMAMSGSCADEGRAFADAITPNATG